MSDTLPSGMRWREYKGVTYQGGQFRGDGFSTPSASAMIYALRNMRNKGLDDSDHPALMDLKANPTEPIPAPPVDRSTEKWQFVFDEMMHAHDVHHSTRGCETVEDSFRLAADRIVALFPTPGVVQVLDGWWNVYPPRAYRHTKQNEAVHAADNLARHTAVRLAVVDPSATAQPITLSDVSAEAFAAEAEKRGFKKFSMSLGVGNGTGQHFVYGDYESIKLAQAKLLSLQPFTEDQAIAALVAAGWGETVVRDTKTSGLTFVADENDTKTRYYATTLGESCHRALIAPTREGA